MAFTFSLDGDTMPGFDLGNSTLTREYAQMFDTVAPGFTETVEQQATAGEPWYTTALRSLSTLVMTNYQRQILNMQLERARQGLPPLPMDQYGVGVGVKVGLSPETMQMVMMGGAALLAVVLLARRR